MQRQIKSRPVGGLRSSDEVTEVVRNQKESHLSAEPRTSQQPLVEEKKNKAAQWKKTLSCQLFFTPCRLSPNLLAVLAPSALSASCWGVKGKPPSPAGRGEEEGGGAGAGCQSFATARALCNTTDQQMCETSRCLTPQRVTQSSATQLQRLVHLD